MISLFRLMFFCLLACCRLTSEVPIYPAHCEGTVVGSECHGQVTYDLNMSTFKASVERREVIQSYPDMPILQRVPGDCVVKDARNWQCTVSDEDGMLTQQMINGQYEMTSRYYVVPPLLTDTVYVSGLKWWRLHLSTRDWGYYWHHVFE